MTEIITGEIVAGNTGPGAGLTGAQLSQLTNLLHAAAELERAQRPIVIIDRQGAEEWAGFTTAPQASAQPAAAPAGPDFGGRYPSPAEFAGVVPMAPLRPGVVVRHWGARLAYAGILALLAGGADGVAAGTGTPAVAACVVGIGAIVGGVVRSELEQNREGAR